MDYAKLTLADVKSGLDALGRETQSAFGGFTSGQLNWRPDAAQWSIAQCFEHLLTANQLVLQAASNALSGTSPPTFWERAPVLPAIWGRLLVRSQAPTTTRKFTAPSKAQPSTSDIAGDIIQRFIKQHHDVVSQIQTVDERDAARAIMTSPFLKVVTYSVLDAFRLLLAHDRRHFEQAQRVTGAPAFPVF